MTEYVSLHTHSDRSFLDGLQSIPGMVSRAVDLGQKAIALTDHQEVAGHLLLQKEAEKAGIKPLFGMEGYLFHDVEQARQDKLKSSANSHITLIAKSNEGLRNLWCWSSEAYTRNFYHKANMDWEGAKPYTKDIFATDGCFAGSERFVTVEGTKTFAETVGTIQKVLGREGTSTAWTEAEIRSFGTQRLVELTLSRDGRQKTILTTGNHRWFVKGKNNSSVERLTSELSVGDPLKSLAPPSNIGRTEPSAVGIQAGIVFGDGTVDVGPTGRRSARVKLYGEKDAQLLKWFPLQPKTDCATEDAIEVRGLPGYFKDLPSLTDSQLNYLYGWLAGYFAADGCVSQIGVATLSSAKRGNIQFVRDVCQVLGIRTGAIRAIERTAPNPKGGVFENTTLYQVSLDVKNLRDNFFLIESHRERVSARRERGLHSWSDWRVVSVEETDRFEEVFCAVVPRGHAFTLEDDIFTGNCMLSFIAQAAIAGDDDELHRLMDKYLETFGDNFRMELHTWQFVDPETDEQRDLNKKMMVANQAKVELAQQYGVPLIVVNDAHFSTPEEWVKHDLVWKMTTKPDPDKMEARGQTAAWIMGDDEVVHWMSRHGISEEITREAIAETSRIADACDVEIKGDLRMPRISPSEEEDLNLFLDHLEEGFERKLGHLPTEQQDLYAERMETEVKLIIEKHFHGYFNVVADYVKFAKGSGWVLTPGRGSSGGSLVTYLMDITAVDPLKYDLLFERFLSVDRADFPDIDTDFPRSKLPLIKQYLAQKYGEDHVCGIGTITNSEPKGILKDLSRALTIPFEDSNAIAKAIPDGADWTKDVTNNTALAPYKDRHRELFTYGEEMVSRARNTSTHASGFIISSEPLLGSVPLRQKKDNGKVGPVTTAFSDFEVEELGFIKFDLLGLNHDDIVGTALDIIEERHGIRHDLEIFGDEQYKDLAIWESVCQGDTVGIFQLSANLMTQTAKRFKPVSEEECALLLAANRPGVIDAGQLTPLIERKHGRETVTYDHPMLEEFLGETYGIIVYQEQMMRISRKLAGFTGAESEWLRRVIGKKKLEQIPKAQKMFYEGCKTNDEFIRLCPRNPDEVIGKIWSSFEASGLYAFNKSHSMGYALLASWEAWLKHYYPGEFLTALLIHDTANFPAHVRYTKGRGFEILPPDVNTSGDNFTLTDAGIRYGLLSVRGVGEKPVEAIVTERKANGPYKSLDDFLGRVPKGKANKTVVTNLIQIGAFDSLDPDRAKLQTEFYDIRKVKEKDRHEIPDYSDNLVGFRLEKFLIGGPITYNPLAEYEDAIAAQCATHESQIDELFKNQTMMVGGLVTKVTTTKTKREGKPMGFVELSFQGADFRFVVFPEAWASYHKLLVEDAPVLLLVSGLGRGNGANVIEVERLDLDE